MKYLEAMFLALIAVFAPMKAAMLTALTLVVADLVTGVLAARKRQEPITSSGFKRTIGKTVLYEVALGLAFLCEQYLTGAALPVSKMVAAMIGMTEIKSVLENLNIINGSSVFDSVLNKIVQSGTKQ